MSISPKLFPWIVPVLVAGCATQPTDQPPITECTEPRPQICTMEYDPVCGKLNGTTKTYASGCTACSDPRVSGYTPGACE